MSATPTIPAPPARLRTQAREAGSSYERDTAARETDSATARETEHVLTSREREAGMDADSAGLRLTRVHNSGSLVRRF